MKSNHLVLMGFSFAILGALFVPAAQAEHVDVSQIPIAADEPIPPMGFPPLPARLDLPIAQAAPRSGFKPATPPYEYHGHPVYSQPSKDAFSQPDQAEQAPVRQPEQEQRRFDRFGVINPNQSQESHVEAPKPITIDQSHSQELSLPNDGQNGPDYSGGHAPRRDGTGQQLQDQFIKKPFQTIRSRLGIF
ncbi:hypothetical protein BH10CYA1_BH10CYA1_18960 [soil metagenome]